MAQWHNILGSAALWNKRVRAAEITPQSIHSLLTGEQMVKRLPSWAITLSSILDSYKGRDKLSDDSDYKIYTSYVSLEPIPFQEILFNFIDYARKKAAERAGNSVEILSSSAFASLQRQLLGHLAFISSFAIGQNFYEFRFRQAPASCIEPVWNLQSTTHLYQSYVQHMLRGGLIDLLDRYPVLARLLSQSVNQWVRSTVKLCKRLSNDFDDLKAFFGLQIDKPKASVSNLRANLSDRHLEGQTVVEVIFQTGESLIFKPRSIGPEIAFNKFIEKLNECGLSLDFKTFKALDRNSYGWVEFVRTMPCHSELEVRRFYTRVGMLLSVLHVLAVTDVHFENLVANGEYPVIVDLETLLDEAIQEFSEVHQENKNDFRFGYETSVLRTGLLPRWQKAADGHQYDMSGLGADHTQKSGLRTHRWIATNTDQMALTEDDSSGVLFNHRVNIGESFPTVFDYLPSFISGFREVYYCLLEYNESLSEDNKLLRYFDNLNLRILVRSTENYARIQLHLLHPEFLKDGIDRSLQLEWLARPLCTNLANKGRNLIYENERSALERLDIPHFSTSRWRNMRFVETDLDLALLGRQRDSKVLKERLKKLSRTDCLKQIEIIENAIRSRYAE